MKSLFSNRKGQAMQGFVAQIVVFGVMIVALAVMAIILGDFRADQLTSGTDQGCDDDSQVNCTVAGNVSTDGLTGLGNVSTQTPTLATILISVLILSAVVGLIFLFRSR